LQIGIPGVDSAVTVNVNFPLSRIGAPEEPAKGALLEPLTMLVRQKRSWSPVLLFGVFWHALTNIRTQCEVLRVFQLPALAEAVRRNPRLPFKHLTRDFLVRGFSIPARAACLMHHYRRLHAALPDLLLRRILRGEVPLVNFHESSGHFTISIGPSWSSHKEGELSLNFHVDGEVVYILSFTIVPGWVVESSSAEILLVTRVQGVKGCYSQISRATKALHDVAPASLLFAALQGIAGKFGIHAIAGVSAVRQIAYEEQYAQAFHTSYDAFFAEMGIAATSQGFFLGPLPTKEKPLAAIKQGHKLRTREKRAFKQQVQSVCAEFFASICAQGANFAKPQTFDLPLPDAVP
jgi:uncharacterized protein VirK/YbjX